MLSKAFGIQELIFVPRIHKNSTYHSQDHNTEFRVSYKHIQKRNTNAV